MVQSSTGPYETGSSHVPTSLKFHCPAAKGLSQYCSTYVHTALPSAKRLAVMHAHEMFSTRADLHLWKWRFRALQAVLISAGNQLWTGRHAVCLVRDLIDRLQLLLSHPFVDERGGH